MSERLRTLPYGTEDRDGHAPPREAEGLPYREKVPHHQNAKTRHPGWWRFADGAQLVGSPISYEWHHPRLTSTLRKYAVHSMQSMPPRHVLWLLVGSAYDTIYLDCSTLHR